MSVSNTDGRTLHTIADQITARIDADAPLSIEELTALRDAIRCEADGSKRVAEALDGQVAAACQDPAENVVLFCQRGPGGRGKGFWA